jgi:GNAT superfamily N-acetyltransferase
VHPKVEGPPGRWIHSLLCRSVGNQDIDDSSPPSNDQSLMRASISIRQATAADAALLAEHRVGMFRDMGAIKPECEGALHEKSIAYFMAAIPSGEYVGWIAYPADDAAPIAGAGVQFRSLLPRPTLTGDGLLLGREGLVLNVYTTPSWRGRGVARQLMDTIIAWAADAGVVRLVLAASPAGRPLYEKMGFVATREMAYSGPLAAAGPWTGAV